MIQPDDGLDVHQRQTCRDHHRAQRSVGQVLQQRRCEQQQQRDAQRADHAGKLRFGARLFGHWCARRAAADGETLEEPGRHVRCTERDDLLVLVDCVAAPQREGARQHAGISEGHQRDRHRACQERRQVAERCERDLKGGQALRQRTYHRDAGR